MKVYPNGDIRKVPSSETVPCKYRGAGIECPKGDAKADVCKSCGWNPLVEMKRIDDAKKQPLKRRPSKRLIFTKRWE